MTLLTGIVLLCLTQAPEFTAAAQTPLGKLILADSLGERRKAYKYALNRVIGYQRGRLKPFLLQVIKQDPLMPPPNAPINGQEAMNSPRRIALSILAEWQDPELVPVFMEYFYYRAPDPNRPSSGGMADIKEHNERAAVKGLINLGKAAVQPLILEVIKGGTPDTSSSPWERDLPAVTLNAEAKLSGVIRYIVYSDDAREHLVAEIDRIAATNQVAARKLREALRRSPSSPPATPGTPSERPKFFSVIHEGWTYRRESYSMGLNHLIGNRRESMKPFLLDVIKTNPLVPPGHGRVFDSKETEFSPRRVALSILAEWHDASLIPLFMDYLDYQAPDRYRSQEPGVVQVPSDLYAGVKGLINIGKPALRPCVEELLKSPLPNESMRKSANDDQRRIYDRYNNLVYVIYGVLGPDAAPKHLAAEADRVGKAHALAGEKLRQAAEFLQRNYPGK